MTRPQVVVVGGGFAGFFACRTLVKRLPEQAADITLISATDHLCYSPLLPEVAAGRLDPRRIAVPLHGTLGRTRVVQARVTDIDFEQRRLTYTSESGTSGSIGTASEIIYDRLILTTGSVSRVFPTPGLNEHAVGLKNLAEATYVRDHVVRQLEAADVCEDPVRRRALLTFIVIGGGYAGTETAAQLQRTTQKQLSRFPRLNAGDLRWIIVDLAEHILPELGPRLGRVALKVIRRRGMEIRLGTSVTSLDGERVTFSDGTSVDAATVLWTAGVEPPKIVQILGLPVRRGRLVVGAQLDLRPDVWAAGDSAASPDPFSSAHLDYAPTAQNAQRQGVVLGRNVAASLGVGKPVEYRHHDLGLVADLGGMASVARPLGIPLTGLPAKIVTKGYHLMALPAMGNRLRVGLDWAANLVSRPAPVQLGQVRASDTRLVPQPVEVSPVSPDHAASSSQPSAPGAIASP